MAAAGEAAAFRLILSDEAIGGQRIMTCKTLPATIAELVQLLQEGDFDLAAACAAHGLDPGKLDAAGGGLVILGLDGTRRVQIRADAALAEFLGKVMETSTPGGSRLPSVEVRLVAPTAATPENDPKDAAATGANEDRAVDSLEAEKAKLVQERERNQKRMEDLERAVRSQVLEAQSIVEIAVRDLTLGQERAVKALEARIDEVKTSDSTRARVIEGVKKELEEVKNRGAEQQGGTGAELSKVGQEIEDLKSMVQKLETAMPKEPSDELFRKTATEVATELLAKEQEKTDGRFTELAKSVEAIASSSAAKEDSSESLRALEQACEELGAKMQKTSEDLEKGLEAKIQQLSEELEKVKSSTAEQLAKNSKRTEDLGAEQERMSASVASSTSSLQATKTGLESSNKEILEKFDGVQKRFDELGKRTEATFLQLNDRLEEMGRVERARLAAMEKDSTEGLARARAECRSETERLRMDYEKDSSRLELDLGDLHAKYDVTKQELNFFQTRLGEQRDWAENQISELRTAAKASQVDTRESTTATTRMLHALRDDAVSFRERMAGYISTLQQSADSQGDAISTLETQRSRIRKELDSLSMDHTGYVEDMDSWADDVRLKVERLFRALEPSRVEWHIARAERKARELRRPLGLKSQGFSLKGLRQVAMEFYPEGHHTSPEGLAVVRIFMPQDAHVRYQVWIGRTSDGVREHEPGSSFSIDLLVESWKEQIQGDGSISIVMEVLRDYRDQDQSLARDIRIESA